MELRTNIFNAGNRIILIFLFLFLVVLFLPNKSSAQFANRIFIGGGITTSEIIGKNWGALPLVKSRDTISIIGGGFTGPQPGFGILITTVLDQEENFKIPFSFEHNFYHSAQRLPLSKNITQYLTHTINLSTISLGLNYAFIHFPLAEAKAYLGVEAKGVFVANDEFIYDRVDENSTNSIRTTTSKKTVFRLGGGAILGIEGKIWDPWYINIYAGFAVMNSIGRDNERGELFTPNIDYQIEKQESYVNYFHSAFIIQYRL